MTATDLITSAMRLIGILAAGEALTPDDAATALPVLNDMIDNWNADRLTIYTTRSDDFPFVAGQQAYTLGPGGNFNAPRPAQIDGISAILTVNPLNPIEIPMEMYTVDQWQSRLPVKNVLGSFPQICYDSGDFPLRILNFWPIPTTANSVRIYSWQALPAQTFASAISFPPGYSQAMRYNLAVLLAAEFSASVNAPIQQIAIDSKATIARMNLPELQLRSDLLSSDTGYSWKADMFGLPY